MASSCLPYCLLILEAIESVKEKFHFAAFSKQNISLKRSLLTATRVNSVKDFKPLTANQVTWVILENHS